MRPPLAMIVIVALATATLAGARPPPIRIIGADGHPTRTIDAPAASAPPRDGAIWPWLGAGALALGAAGAGCAWAWRRWSRLPIEDRAFRLLALRLGLGHEMRRQIERIAAAGKVSPIAVVLSPGALDRLAPKSGLGPEDLAPLRRRLRS